MPSLANCRPWHVHDMPMTCQDSQNVDRGMPMTCQASQNVDHDMSMARQWHVKTRKMSTMACQWHAKPRQMSTLACQMPTMACQWHAKPRILALKKLAASLATSLASCRQQARLAPTLTMPNCTAGMSKRVENLQTMSSPIFIDNFPAQPAPYS